jgi:LPXTG-site transpeptidase (sortase) family protein
MKLFQKILNKKYKIIIFLIIIFFLIFISYFAIRTSAKNITVTPIEKSDVLPVQEKQTTLISEIPIRIKIPKIGVDALVENLGLTKDGMVNSPVSPVNVGWWNGGPIPGAIGNAVIDGHSGWKDNIPAVFDNLKDLQNGDEIYVTNNSGITTTFVINKLKIYGKNDKALDVFISTDDKSHLNLITCTGIWNNIVEGRDSRLVVFADLKIQK